MVEEITPTATPSPPGLATYWNALLKRKDVNGSLTLSENETRLITSLITNLINQTAANETSITVAMLNSKLNGIQKTVNNLLHVQNRPSEVKSWAQVAKGDTMRQMTNTLVDARPPPPKRLINEYKPSSLIIRRLPDTNPFPEMTPPEITSTINNVLKEIDAKLEDEQIQIKGVTRLQSGDLKIYAKSRAATKWLFEHKHKWTHKADPLLVTPPSKYPVILHSIPTIFDPTSVSFKTELCGENGIDQEKIQAIKWLGRPKEEGKTHGSIVLALFDKEVASKVEKGGLFLQNMYLPGARYNRPPMQCYRCLEMNHSARFCPNEPLCSSCGGSHESRTCNVEDTDLRCVKCWNTAKANPEGNLPDPTNEKFAHSVFSSICPIKKAVAPQSRRFFMNKKI
ncbi:hypothetical protein DFH28DRAFT_906209 [Melampsora americana]|nr:hypothetical protein DFH28DRAFT_906209 [Melampsora americana]